MIGGETRGDLVWALDWHQFDERAPASCGEYDMKRQAVEVRIVRDDDSRVGKVAAHPPDRVDSALGSLLDALAETLIFARPIIDVGIDESIFFHRAECRVQGDPDIVQR